MRLNFVLEKYLPLISGMLMPATVFAFCLFKFLGNDGVSHAVGEFCHWNIYIFGISTLLLQLYFNKGKGVFWIATTLLFYTLINYMKNAIGLTYYQYAPYQTIIAALPYNLLFFYIYNPRKIISRHSLLILIGILFEYGIIDTLLKLNIYPIFYFYSINIISVLGFLILISLSLIKSVQEGDSWDYSILYSGISMAVACFYLDFSGQELFVFLNVFFIFADILFNLIYEHFFDKQSGLKNRNSYHYYASRLPLKYSLAIIKIDFYDSLIKKIGLYNMRIIITLINDVFQEYIGEDLIFRYSEDQFLIIYKKYDLKEAYSHIEEIRRGIAGLNFAYSSKLPPLKITISCGVSEKKRSDKDVFEVYARAEKAMNETAKLSHNVTTKG